MHRAAALPVSTGPVCHWTSHCPRRRSCCPGSGGARRFVRSVLEQEQWSDHHGRAVRGIYCGILLLLKVSRGPDV